MPEERTAVTVLLVDDEPDVLDSYRTLFELELGVRVLTATSGKKALELLGRERVDLVITDYRMPGMDGIEFLERARKSWPELPFYLFTAFGTEDIRDRAREANVSRFVSKAIEPAELAKLVGRDAARAA